MAIGGAPECALATRLRLNSLHPTPCSASPSRRSRQGFDSVFVSDHFQPWKHTDGHAPFAPSWLGAVGARTSRIVMGTSVLTPTFRLHPSVVAHAFGTLGAMFPGRVILGVGTGESLNEVPRHRHGLARAQGALGPPARGDPAHPPALDRRPRQLHRRLLQDRERHDLRQAGRAGADLHCRRRSAERQICRPRRRRLHLHLGQGGDALHRDAPPQRRRRPRRVAAPSRSSG